MTRSALRNSNSTQASCGFCRVNSTLSAAGQAKARLPPRLEPGPALAEFAFEGPTARSVQFPPVSYRPPFNRAIKS